MLRPRYLCLLLAVAGCGEATRAQPDTLQSSPPASASARPDGVVTAAPLPSSEQKLVVQSPLVPTLSDTKIPLAAIRLDLALIDERGYLGAMDWGLRLHPQRTQMFVSHGGYIARLDADVLRFEQRISYENMSRDVLQISGEFPQIAHAKVLEDRGRLAPFSRVPSYEKLVLSYHWDQKEWKEGPQEEVPDRLVAWSDKALLGLKEGLLVAVSSSSPSGEDTRPVPSQTKPIHPEKCAGASVEVSGMALDAPTRGELFVVGRRCGGGVALEHWPAGQSASRLIELADAPADPKTAFVSTPKSGSAWVVFSDGGKVYATRLEGASLQRLALDLEGTVESVFATADGTLFFTLHAKDAAPTNQMVSLVRVRATGEVSRSANFVRGYPNGLWARDADTVFVESARALLLTTRPNVVFENKVWETTDSYANGGDLLPKHEAGCTTPLVFLYDVGSGSPDNFAFPKTVIALSSFPRVKEISVVEFKVLNRRRLGVRVPSEEVGNEVISHVKETMKDEKPKLVCFVPKDDVRKVGIPLLPPKK